jgi:hypothetical protein
MDQADGRELGGELAVALFVVGEPLVGGGWWHLVSVSPASVVEYPPRSVEPEPPHTNRPTSRRADRHQAASGARGAPERGRAGARPGEHRLRALSPHEATAHGGVGAIAKLVNDVGVASEIDCSLDLLKLHKPYYGSDHVLNIAHNTLFGGQSLGDIEARRCDRVFLDGLGIESLPDPATAGDLCRRFDPGAALALQEAFNPPG